MKHPLRKASLSPARQRLVDLMQRVDFGIIEDLEVRDGEPVVDRPLTALRDILIGQPDGPRTRARVSDFQLRDEVRELFELFSRERNFRIARLTVQGGLPHRLKVRASVGS